LAQLVGQSVGRWVGWASAEKGSNNNYPPSEYKYKQPMDKCMNYEWMDDVRMAYNGDKKEGEKKEE
jgi:hypothetical protein